MRWPAKLIIALSAWRPHHWTLVSFYFISLTVSLSRWHQSLPPVVAITSCDSQLVLAKTHNQPVDGQHLAQWSVLAPWICNNLLSLRTTFRGKTTFQSDNISERQHWNGRDEAGCWLFKFIIIVVDGQNHHIMAHIISRIWVVVTSCCISWIMLYEKRRNGAKVGQSLESPRAKVPDFFDFFLSLVGHWKRWKQQLETLNWQCGHKCNTHSIEPILYSMTTRSLPLSSVNVLHRCVCSYIWLASPNLVESCQDAGNQRNTSSSLHD